MKPVYIFRHISYEGPGYLAQVLESRRIPYRIIAIDQGEALPPGVEESSALVFMGGSMSVNDPLPWLGEELRLIRQAAERGLPVLGHCLGGQLISKALGGRVGPNPVREIGWYAVERIENPAARAWLDGLPPRFEVFHWHSETFTLPAGAVPILQSRHCPNQAFVHGNILALQCHIEMTAEIAAEWAERHGADLTQPSESVQGAEQMLTDLQTRVTRLHRVADVLYGHWLKALAP